MPLKAGRIAEVDLAYAAGIVDGEGSISAPASHRCPTNFRIVPEFMASTFGGKVRVEKRKTKSGKSIYSWRLYCRNAADALTLMMPYLRIKADRARNAAKLASMMKARRLAKSTELSPDEIAQRHQLARLVTAANFSSNGRIACYAP